MVVFCQWLYITPKSYKRKPFLSKYPSLNKYAIFWSLKKIGENGLTRVGLNNHNQLKKPSISSEAKRQQIRSWESFCKTQAFFSWKPIPCPKEAFICSVYCHYTINKCHKKQLQTWAWGLLTLTPSGRLVLHAAFLPGTSFPGLCHCLLFKGKWHLSVPDPGRSRNTSFLQPSFSSSEQISVYPLELRSGLQIFLSHLPCNLSTESLSFTTYPFTLLASRTGSW